MSLLEERIEKYIELQEDLEYAEEKASEYRSVQDDYGRCGYNDEDTIYHSCGMTALSYENEMDNIEEQIEENDVDHEIVTHLFIEEIKQLDFTRKLFNDIQSYINVYTDNYEIYMLSDFNNEEEIIQKGLDLYGTITNKYNYVNYKFNKQFENSIVVYKKDAENNKKIQTDTIKTYYISDFFFILKEIINTDIYEFEIYDGEMSEELEMLVEILTNNEKSDNMNSLKYETKFSEIDDLILVDEKEYNNNNEYTVDKDELLHFLIINTIKESKKVAENCYKIRTDDSVFYIICPLSASETIKQRYKEIINILN